MTLKARQTPTQSTPTEARNTLDTLGLSQRETLMRWNDPHSAEHFVQFYETDDFLLDSVSDFVGAGLGSGAACIVIATPAHRRSLSQRLQDNGLDPASAHARGKYFALDAAQTLAQFLRKEHPIRSSSLGSSVA